MWTYRSEQRANRHDWYALDAEGTPISYRDVLQLWQVDAGFQSFFNGLLAASPFAEFRWETPPITTATVNRPFEFVVTESPGLARTPDDTAFREQFRSQATESVVQFSNLGKDAVLVVPSPMGPSSAYGHLASFVREAPQSQQHALWSLVGTALRRRLNTHPVWLSTAGAGVPWLHVRLDDQPKYYGYAPYRQIG